MSWWEFVATADFTNLYTGWSMVLSGRGRELYDFAVQAEVQRDILGGRFLADGLLPYVNPPHLTPWLAPLALLSLPAAYLTWLGLQLGLVAYILRWLLQELAAHWTPRERLWLAGCTLGFLPLPLALSQGAVTLLVLAAGLAGAKLLVRGRPLGAGAWLAVAAIKPQMIFLLPVALLARREWRVLAGFGGATALLAVAALPVIGWEPFMQYPALVLEHAGRHGGQGGVHPGAMWTVRGTMALVLGPDGAGVASVVAWASLVLAVLLTVWIWVRAETVERQLLAMALTLLLTALTAPHLNVHDTVLLIPGAALAYGVLRQRGAGRSMGVVLAASPFLILVSELTIRGRIGVRVPFVLMVVLTAWVGRAFGEPIADQ